MQPDLDFQLSVVLTTLKKVVLPAVDADNKPVQEQLHLAIRTVEGVLERIPYRRRFVREELRLLLVLAGQAVAVLQSEDQQSILSVQAMIETAEEAYRNVDVDTGLLVEYTAKLSSGITELLKSFQGETVYNDLSLLVVQHSKALTNLARAWCSDNGLETEFALDMLAHRA